MNTSNVELSTRITRIEQAIIAMNDKILILQVEMKKYATQGQLKTSESNTKNLINQNSIMISDLQKRLEIISIPSDSRYYLSTTEIQEFRNNYQTLIAMMTDAEKLYQSLVSYVTQFNVK